MTLYSKGDKVIRISSKDKGIITAIGPCGRGGRQLYRVDFKGVETDELEGNLMPYCDMEDPFELCKNNIYGSYTEFSKINTTFKIHNTSISTISSLKASKTIFKPYQFKPLLKFLNSDNKRIIVADEVGLGKTIEAGHIMLELKARNEFHNALVICPLSLQLKWKTELKDKFGLTFTLVDSVKELIQLLIDCDGSARAIINYDKIRSYKDPYTDEENNPLIKFLTENPKTFSIILCDEAHKLRNENTQTYKGAERILENANSVVFLTATPIMISERNLYNLLHLIDKQRFSNYAMFEQGLKENAPFIKASAELATKEPLTRIAKKLAEYEITLRHKINERIYTEVHTVQERFEDFPLYKRIIERMQNEKDTLMLRSQLQNDIMSMSQINQVLSRTRKREVTTDWSQAERHPYPCIVKLYDEEQKEFDKVIENYIDDNSYTNVWGEQRMSLGGTLGLVQKKRQIASSVYAYLNDEASLLSGIDDYALKPDAKFDKLLDIINNVFVNGLHKIIIFALFKKTLYYLNIRLKRAGYNCVMIHGGIKNREEVLSQFKDNNKIEILLSSEVGSEGLDLQFCNAMVNYDLPWNPMVVEQRIGRIDRFGQESPIVHIYNMIVKDSVQEDIYMRLLNRIGIFRESIGEMEAILDAEVEKNGTNGVVSLQQLYSGMEKDLFCTHLSVEERQRKIDEIAQAFINEKENLKKIEEGLTNSLTNDSYFRNEINRILKDNAYVTETELRNYIEMLINEHLTTCQLEKVDDLVYEIILPKSNIKVLSNFLTTYQPKGEENYTLFKQFRNRIKDEQKIKITFNQDYAYKHKNILFINLYNPIIQATSLYFSQREEKRQKTFRFDLSSERVNLPLDNGVYFLAVYQVETSKIVFGNKVVSYTSRPFLFDVKRRCVIENEDLANSFLGKAQVCGEYQRYDTTKGIDENLITDLQIDMAEAIDFYRSTFVKELKLKSENNIMTRKQQVESYYKYRINNMVASIKETENRLALASKIKDETEIRKSESLLRLQNHNLYALEGEMEDEICRVSQDPKIEVRTSLLSINLINLK